MKSKYDYDIIRDYLHGLLDKETSTAIRELIRNDEVARNIAAGILQLEHEFYGNEEEMEAYIEVLRQKQLKLIRNGQNNFKWIAMAAGFLLIAVIGAIVVLQNNDLIEDELSTPYPLTIQRGDNDNKAYEFYSRGDYKNAIPLFADDDMFYKGLSYLYTGDYDNAIVLLGSDAVKSTRYNEQARWFQALALIKAGRKDEAKKNLELIGSDFSHYKSAEARKLLSSYEEK